MSVNVQNQDDDSDSNAGGTCAVGGKLNELLKATIATAALNRHLPTGELKHVNVDTTVREKNITPPTGSKLLSKAIEKLGVAAKSRVIPLRQSYVRVGKRASIRAGRYAHAKQFKRMRRQWRKRRTYVGRMIRDIERKTP